MMGKDPFFYPEENLAPDTELPFERGQFFFEWTNVLEMINKSEERGKLDRGTVIPMRQH